MSGRVDAQRAAPSAGVERPGLPERRRLVGRSVALNVRGRTIRLRGVRLPPGGAFAWLAVLGPGLIAANAGNDAGGVATYGQTGARYGYDLLWLLAVITVSLAVVQEMCARLGAATGRGLLDLVRERFGIAWALFAVAVVVVANAGTLVTEFVGVGAAAELLGVPRLVAVPLAAALVWYLVTGGAYSAVEKVFLGMTLVFFAYPVAAVLAHPAWGEVARGFVPKAPAGPDALVTVVALIGTTITPYMQLFQQSSVVEKGVSREGYGPERIDAYAGALFSNVVAGFIIIATAATLHAAGKTEIATAADAAQALQPVAGDAAQAIFAVGLIGASLLAAGVLPLATAYSVSEAFGFRKGVSLDFRRAPFFLGLFTCLVVLAALMALVPGVPVIQLLVAIQVLNGVLLPVVLLFVLLLINDARLTRGLKNTARYNVLAWGTFVLVTSAVAVLLGSQLVGLLGGG